MREKKIEMAVVSIAMFVAGCAFNRASVPQIAAPELHVEALKRTEYSILGPATGKSCATYIGLWPLPVFWVQTDGSDGKPYALNVYAIALSEALSRAAQSVPSADAVLAPRVQEEGSTVGVWYKNVCTTVAGKAIEIKADAK